MNILMLGAGRKNVYMQCGLICFDASPKALAAAAAAPGFGMIQARGSSKAIEVDGEQTDNQCMGGSAAVLLLNSCTHEPSPPVRECGGKPSGRRCHDQASGCLRGSVFGKLDCDLVGRVLGHLTARVFVSHKKLLAHPMWCTPSTCDVSAFGNMLLQLELRVPLLRVF